MTTPETVREPARDIPVYGSCDVLVIGGGPAGTAAAASAARLGADVILMERYGHLGGMSTGGFVLWIDRMTDWEGRQVITGFANEILDRLPKDALLGPDSELWGSKDPRLVEYWQERSSAFNGQVTWAPTVDPEMLKLASMDIVLERGVRMLLHAWGVAVIQEGNDIKGVVFESKSGRQAILAKTVIDATGDGDIFALAGGDFENDIDGDPNSIHHRMNVAFLWGGADMNRYIDFKLKNPDEFRAITALRGDKDPFARPGAMPRNDMALFMGPKLSGYNSLDVDDLTSVEIESRRRMMDMLDFYRENMPGFEDAWVMTTAPQIGTRHSRRLIGTKKMTHEDWSAGVLHDDEIGVSPPPNTRNPNVSIPYGCMLPTDLENILAAGRNLSSDAATHTFMREVPNCWVLGQGAGVAAALAVSSGVGVRDVDMAAVRAELLKQGVVMHREAG